MIKSIPGSDKRRIHPTNLPSFAAHDVVPILTDTACSVTATEAVLRELADCPISTRQEKILRTIASKYYQRGYCFAKHETIAAAVGCAKSTLQLDLDLLEARGLISVTPRPCTSNVTVLASGLVEALRALRIQRQRTKFSSTIGTCHVLGSDELVESISKKAVAELSMNPEASGSTHAPATAEKSTEKAATISHFCSNRPKAVSQPKTSSSYLNSTNITNSVVEKKEKTIENDLRIAGVTSSKAIELVREYGVERCRMNFALGIHVKASNPGGFLAAAIRENYAAAQVPRPKRLHDGVDQKQAMRDLLNPAFTRPKSTDPDATAFALITELVSAPFRIHPTTAHALVNNFGVEHCCEQLKQLPALRTLKNPAGFVVAAISQGFYPPTDAVSKPHATVAPPLSSSVHALESADRIATAARDASLAERLVRFEQSLSADDLADIDREIPAYIRERGLSISRSANPAMNRNVFECMLDSIRRELIRSRYTRITIDNLSLHETEIVDIAVLEKSLDATHIRK